MNIIIIIIFIIILIINVMNTNQIFIHAIFNDI